MKPYKILTIPNPILRKKSKPISKIDNEIKEIGERMLFTLGGSELGLGLAAPQVGKNLRIIAVGAQEIRDEDNRILQKEIPLTIFVNPIITKFSKAKVIADEGCLCYVNYYGPVERSQKIRFEAQTLDGKKKKINASGLFARIIQHEVDHLDGILFIDKLTDKSKLRRISSDEDPK